MILDKLIEERGWLLADGATGTNLFSMGLATGESPELLNRDSRDIVTRLYQDAVDAGVDLFLTNTFGANRCRLKLHDAGDSAYELARLGAELAREVVDRHHGKCIIAGSMGPTGELFEPLGSLTMPDAIDAFLEQAEGLKAGGADVLWVETMSSREEYAAAAEACSLVDMPWCGTMSFDTKGRTMMGISPADLVEFSAECPVPPVAIGANCGAGVGELLISILDITDAAPGKTVIAKGNAGIPKFVDGHIHYDGTPEVMAQYAAYARDAGARIIGGCCGTTSRHIEAIRERLETSPTGDRPDRSLLMSEFNTSGPVARGASRRQGRRRK